MYNEEFQTDHVGGAHSLNFTVFHKAAFPPDEFVANGSLVLNQFGADVIHKVWVELEPSGKLHVSIELDGTFTEG